MKPCIALFLPALTGCSFLENCYYTEITSLPPGAEIFLDGKSLGIEPVTIEWKMPPFRGPWLSRDEEHFVTAKHGEAVFKEVDYLFFPFVYSGPDPGGRRYASLPRGILFNLNDPSILRTGNYDSP